MIIPRGSFGSGMTGFRLVPEVKISTFFDKAEVISALSESERKALTGASLLVRRTAQKSIQKVGMAKPKVKEMKANPGMRLGDILRTQKLTDRKRAQIVQRIKEIQNKRQSASRPGSPPNTHVPYGHMLGFRRNLYNAYDKSSKSAVVGPSKKGTDWQVPQLHEFGGSKQLVAYVWRPKYQPYRKPIVQWVSRMSKLSDDWIPLGQSKVVSYPPRPYMRPALAQNRGKIADMFRGTFGK